MEKKIEGGVIVGYVGEEKKPEKAEPEKAKTKKAKK